MPELDGKVAFVTGGTGSLGRIVCRMLAGEGCSLFLTWRNETHLEETISTLPPGSRVSHIRTDVTDEADVPRAAQAVLQEYGQVDILLNLTGGYLPGGKNLWETEPADWDRLMSINARSCFLVSRAILPAMIERRQGKVVSVSARPAAQRLARTSAYAASKAIVALLTETLAKEVRDYNINVNAVMPQTMNTEANRKAMPQADTSKWVKPEEVAEVILFLVSEKASGINGAVVPVFGKG